MPSNRKALLLAAIVAGCAPVARSSGTGSGLEDINRTAPSTAAVDKWADSVLSKLTLREKAAQMVWPSVFGDYTSGDSPQWQRLTSYVSTEKVGGFTISVGSPIE